MTINRIIHFPTICLSFHTVRVVLFIENIPIQAFSKLLSFLTLVCDNKVWYRNPALWLQNIKFLEAIRCLLFSFNLPAFQNPVLPISEGVKDENVLSSLAWPDPVSLICFNMQRLPYISQLQLQRLDFSAFLHLYSSSPFPSKKKCANDKCMFWSYLSNKILTAFSRPSGKKIPSMYLTKFLTATDSDKEVLGHNLKSVIRGYQRSRKLFLAKPLQPLFLTLARWPGGGTSSCFWKEPAANTQAFLTLPPHCFPKGRSHCTSQSGVIH